MPNKVLKFKNSDSKNLFKIKNSASDNTAEIIIYGSIGDDWYEDAAVSAKQFSEALAALPKNITQIDLRLNSPGGSVFDGVTIYERLKQHPANVTVYVDGIAASIASIIAMAGNEIIIGEGSFIMIHKPLTMTWGNSDDHERNIRILDGIESQMLNIYSKKTGLGRTELENMLTQETWMDANTCLANGFATSISDSSENLRVAASMVSSAKWISKTNAPKIEDTKLIKAKIADIQKKMNAFSNVKK